jgi:hypothetical protein
MHCEKPILPTDYGVVTLLRGNDWPYHQACFMDLMGLANGVPPVVTNN